MKKLLCLLLCALCSVARADDRLVILSPHWEGIRYETTAGFKEFYRQRTGREIEVTYRDVGGTSQILRFVHSEFERSPSSIGIDLVFGGGTDPFLELKRSNFLTPYRLPESMAGSVGTHVGGLPLHDPEGFFLSPMMAVFGIVCNREALRRLQIPQPTTWEDLLRPEMRGYLMSADPRFSGSVHMAYEIFLQAFGWERGWEFIYGFAQNLRGFTPNSTQVITDIANGDVGCSISIDSQAANLMRLVGEHNISFTVPPGLSIANGDGVAIVRGAPHYDAAKLFVEFLFTETMQRRLMGPRGATGGPERYNLGRLGVLPALYDDQSLRGPLTIRPFDWAKTFNYDSQVAVARWEIINDLIGIFVIERLDSLHSTQSATPATLAPPISAAEADTLARQGASDAAMRATRAAQWRAKAEQELLSLPLSALLWRATPVGFIILIVIALRIKRAVRRRDLT